MKNSMGRGVIISFLVGALILAGLIAGVVVLDTSDEDGGSGDSDDLTQGEPQRNEAGYITYPESYAGRVVRTIIHQASVSPQGESSFSLEQWTAFDDETEPERLMQVVREQDGNVVIAVEGTRESDSGRRYNQSEGEQCGDIAWENATQTASSGLPSHADQETNDAQQLSEGGQVSEMVADLEFDVEVAGDPAISLTPDLSEAEAWTGQGGQQGMQGQQTSFMDEDTGLLVGTQLTQTGEDSDEVQAAQLQRVAHLAVYDAEEGNDAMDTAIEWDSFCS